MTMKIDSCCMLYAGVEMRLRSQWFEIYGLCNTTMHMIQATVQFNQAVCGALSCLELSEYLSH